MGAQKMKYTFIYTITLHHRLCVFLLNLSKVYFQVRKHTFSIVNHPTDHQHFNIKLQLHSYCVCYSLPKITFLAGNNMPIKPVNTSLIIQMKKYFQSHYYFMGQYCQTGLLKILNLMNILIITGYDHFLDLSTA